MTSSSRIVPGVVALAALSAVAFVVAVVISGQAASQTALLQAPESPQMHVEVFKCLQLAKSYKGVTTAEKSPTKAQKKTATQCLHLMHKLRAERAQSLAAKTTGLTGKEPACNCCAFAGCPCCQPAIKSGVTKLEHIEKKPLVHKKKPIFHNKKKFAFHNKAKIWTEPAEQHKGIKLGFDF
eukprot:CAMPEP_0181324126 /NCGR_PEP_ID=MMETSP1101-20121128/20179_1 /TAXON_ID=46948 /ORGANISM="Rhodomonas abbreviata, Strain Caron Lab Isolate" /LENGTH=180 /DNA_ID=CAMNT_0023432253 /DNA_START=12 /DNA_END=554 /DNA_ORIENTATION=+